jgi:hypothetical protein
MVTPAIGRTAMKSIGLSLTMLGALLISMVAGIASPLSAQSITVSNFTPPLDLGTTKTGTAGAASTYTLDGSGLTADISVTAPAGCEVSQTDAMTGFAVNVVVVRAGGVVAAQTIWVRISASAAVGAIAGDVTNESVGATTQNVPVIGTVEQGFICHVDLGRGLGFWANKNGKAILAANDTAWRDALNMLNLVNEDGSAYDVPAGDFNDAHADFRAWILGANARNMAYMLSAQMAALVLNLEFGPMSAFEDLHVTWMGNKVPVSGPINDANALLASHPVAMPGTQERDDEEALKDLFDAINSGCKPVCEPQGGTPPAENALASASAPGGGGGHDAMGCAAGAAGFPAVLLAAALWRRRRA